MTVDRQLASLADRELIQEIEQNADDEAIKELEYRAAHGRPGLYAVLSGYFSKGVGAVEIDCDRALRYLHEGIAKGSKDVCQLALANCYYFGECVEKDYSRAFKLTYQVAVNEDDPLAASRLALMYEWGHGCRSDLDAAERWMRTAWKRGSIAAIGQCARILIKKGHRFRGLLIRVLAFLNLPLILIRGFSDPRNRIW